VAKDPIVEEIHQTREELLKEFGGMDGYMVHLAQLQAELGDRVVRREPRKAMPPPKHRAS
jgi:hypothetical protein